MTEPIIAAANFSDLTPDQRTSAEKAQDRRMYLCRNTRINLENALVAFNRVRAEIGMGPVTLRIPEEQP